jgi:copper(I)-binding protein
MIRAGSLLAFSVFLAAIGFAGAVDATPIAEGQADSPATPAVVLAPADITDAVPISLRIENHGDNPDRLLGGSSPIAERIEVHRTRLVEGRPTMFVLPDGLDIPAGATLTLEPGADHLMLSAPRVTLIQGRTFPLTLHFRHAGDVEVTGRVRRRVDAAGTSPVPPVVAGEISVSLVSAPPVPASSATPVAP